MTNLRNEPARAVDFEPDPEAMRRAAEVAERAKHLPPQLATMAPRPTGAQATKKWDARTHRWVAADGSEDLQPTQPPDDLDAQLADIRARNDRIAAAQRAEDERLERERTRLERIEERLAALERKL